MRRALIVLALLAAAGCSHNDIDCLGDFNHDDPECLTDAHVTVEDTDIYVGEPIVVTVMSGSRSATKSGTVGGDTVRFTFVDFIREGGGPYTVHLLIDLTHDGACNNPPLDATWSETFDDDDTEWVMDIDNGMDPICD